MHVAVEANCECVPMETSDRSQGRQHACAWLQWLAMCAYMGVGQWQELAWIWAHKELWGFGCWCALVWLQGVAVSMHTVLQASDRSQGCCYVGAS